MTTRNLGQTGFASDIEVAHTGPLDARLVTPLKSELTSMAFAYKGMIVAVIDDGSNNGLYRLTDTDKTQASNWVLVGSNITVSDLYTLLGVDQSSTDENYLRKDGTFATPTGSTITVSDLYTLLGVDTTSTDENFLRKDGTFATPTVDLSAYATIASLASYLPLTGGTLTGNLYLNQKSLTLGQVQTDNSKGIYWHAPDGTPNTGYGTGVDGYGRWAFETACRRIRSI